MDDLTIHSSGPRPTTSRNTRVAACRARMVQRMRRWLQSAEDRIDRSVEVVDPGSRDAPRRSSITSPCSSDG
jgi:hypothetical protein